MKLREVLLRLAGLCLLVLLIGLLGSALLRMAPGYGTDERALDPRLSAESIAAIREGVSQQPGLLAAYWRQLEGLARADLGYSQTLASPVGSLLRQRLPLTLRLAGRGLLLAWVGALGLALALVFWGGMLAPISSFAGSAALSIPSAVAALVILHLDWPAEIAVAVVLFGRLHAYCRRILDRTCALPHVIFARAKGLGGLAVLFRHVTLPALPEFLALAGVSVGIALGVCVPIEVICGLPGIGQLVWLSATGRDLPVVVSLAWLAGTLTIVANTSADVAILGLRRRA